MTIGRWLLCGVLMLSVGCPLFDTPSDEGTLGRGPAAFDPYGSTRSPALRLSLQMYNGCAVFPTGEVAGKGTAQFPYDCVYNPAANGPLWPSRPTSQPTRPLSIASGQNYFLNQITLSHSVFGNFPKLSDTQRVPKWFQGLPRFGKLDWSGLNIIADDWEPSERSPSPIHWKHRVLWGNAAWELVKGDTFTLELLDADGTVRATQTYPREQFLAENPGSYRTLLSWEQDNVLRPTDLSTDVPAPAPNPPVGYPPSMPAMQQTLFKFEAVSQITPSNSFKVPEGLTGDGSIRLTWSQLPDDPFYFPVRLVDLETLPPDCYSVDNPSQRVPCTFGLVPEASFARPANGEFYQPGETLSVTLSAKDANGNFLHPPGAFASWNENIEDRSNGVLYFNWWTNYEAMDRDTITGFQMAGPKQDLRIQYDLGKRRYWAAPTDQFIPGQGNEGLSVINGPIVSGNFVPGLRDHHPPTTRHITLPADAAPGTYTLYWKVHRYFLGERLSQMVGFDVQVGQAEPTQFPLRVGNCQICHRGTISLENVKHGIGVDDVEGCKACHFRDTFTDGRNHTMVVMHRIHMTSNKFPLPKNQCSVCHLTRESALRPSLAVCGSCHPQPHGDRFALLSQAHDFDATQESNVFGNCANACHALTPPARHALPER